MSQVIHETLLKMDRLLLEQFLQLSRQAGLKLPDSDLLIAKEILKLGHHVSCEQVRKHLRDCFPNAEAADFERILELLIQYRIVSVAQIDGNHTLEHNHAERRHFHLVCLKSNTVSEFQSPVIEELIWEISKQQNFQPVVMEVNIYGLSGTYVDPKMAREFPLLKALENQVVEVCNLGEQDSEFLARATEAGFSVGARIEVLGLTSDGSDLLARLRTSRIVLPVSRAQKVMVRPLSSDEARQVLDGFDSAMQEHLALSDLMDGQSARVIRVIGSSPFRQRLLELGFVPGSLVKRLRTAPLADPMAFELRGFVVSLRQSEAKDIQIEVVT